MDPKTNPQLKRLRYTNAQMLVHNMPLLTMFVLGVILTVFFSIYLAIFFIIYLIISNYLYMALICGYCHHYGTRTSLCGYGLLAKRITKRKSYKEFGSNFKKYIAVMFPNWFLPFIVGIYVLYLSFDWIILIILIIFSVIGFAVVPYFSKTESCETCKIRDSCPWMSLYSKSSSK
jgi:hypothetical protein